MTGFFDRMLGRNPGKRSGATAKDRLQFVLLHDRLNIAPEKMHEMKQEIIAVIAKYVPEIDTESVEIGFEQSDRHNNKLVAEIPMAKARSGSADAIDENDDLLADSAEQEPSAISDTNISDASDSDDHDIVDPTKSVDNPANSPLSTDQ